MRYVKTILYSLLIVLTLTGCGRKVETQEGETAVPLVLNQEIIISDDFAFHINKESKEETDSVNNDSRGIDALPVYSGEPYAILNDNKPLFTKSDMVLYSFEEYSSFDELGRCGVAYANICLELMPSEERGSIGAIKPSGWHTVKYNDLIDGNYLYNRCHLIGYQLAGENSNELNLITGTRYLNIQGMLPFENMVMEYVKESGNHVLYRVTPIFEEDNLVASGVTIEAYSVEDNGRGICLYIYAFNIQPGIIIDYSNGDSERDPNYEGTGTKIIDDEINQVTIDNSTSVEDITYPQGTYILNTNTLKIHYPYCESVSDMAEKNKCATTESVDSLILQGYTPCKRCNP